MPARTVDAKRVAGALSELLQVYEGLLIGGPLPPDWTARRDRAKEACNEIVHDLAMDQRTASANPDTVAALLRLSEAELRELLAFSASERLVQVWLSRVPDPVAPPEPVQKAPDNGVLISEPGDRPCVRCNHRWGAHRYFPSGCDHFLGTGLEECACPGYQPPLVEIPAAAFYDCCSNEETLEHDDPVEAISEWVEQNANQGESVAQVFARKGMGGLEVVCYTRLVVTPQWVSLHAGTMIDRLAEAFGEDFGDPEGEDYKTSSAVRRQFEAAVEALTKEWHIWGCDDAARVVVPVAQVVDMLWSPADQPEESKP